jgi:hypothetical protein
MLELLERKIVKKEILKQICSLIETKANVGKCIYLVKTSHLLAGGDGDRQNVYIPLEDDSIYGQALKGNKPQIYNDFKHDRSIL